MTTRTRKHDTGTEEELIVVVVLTQVEIRQIKHAPTRIYNAQECDTRKQKLTSV